MSKEDQIAFKEACLNFKAKSQEKDLDEYFWKAALKHRDSNLENDPLRIAAKLGIGVQFTRQYAVAYVGSVHNIQFSEPIKGDPYEAVCSAIRRAAEQLNTETRGVS